MSRGEKKYKKSTKQSIELHLGRGKVLGEHIPIYHSWPVALEVKYIGKGELFLVGVGWIRWY